MNILKNNTAYDVVVVGTGLAGIKAAITAAQSGCSVLLCTKSVLCSGSSFYTLMDTLHCQATINEADKAVFLQDIVACSYNMNDTVMNQYYIDHICERIEEFPEMGIAFEKLPEPKLACFATHAHTLYAWTDWPAIRSNLRKILANTPKITVREAVAAANLLTRTGSDGTLTVEGVVLYDKKSGAFEAVACASVIFATGGFGSLYEHNLNSPDVTGDGHALALAAGAQLINLEFNQFIPGLIDPVYKIVFREGTLEHCRALLSRDGTDVLRGLLPDAAQYDACLRMRAFHGPFTSADDSKYFDIALMKACLAEQHTSGIEIAYASTLYQDDRSYIRNYLDWLRTVYAVDLCRQKVTLAPFFHAANGGIYVDHRCETSVKGLFACGEAAGGIHGADRLGGNATGSCLVFGHLAANSAVEHAKAQASRPVAEEARVLASLRHRYDSAVPQSVLPAQVIDRVKKMMWSHASVLRTEQGLCAVAQQLAALQKSYNAWSFLDVPLATPAALQAQHALTLAPALICAMQARRESRGSHFREDYPQMDFAFDARLCIGQKDGALHYNFEPSKGK